VYRSTTSNPSVRRTSASEYLAIDGADVTPAGSKVRRAATPLAD
jgi:hypothetical protein